ncbi:MAG: hypothetical protein Q7T49_00515 [bacterium]|nr:hypothetical protein [bacterium]
MMGFYNGVYGGMMGGWGGGMMLVVWVLALIGLVTVIQWIIKQNKK